MEIDRLDIAIEADVAKANAEFDKLIEKLNLVQNAFKKDGNAANGLSNSVKAATNSSQKGVSSMIAGFTKLGIVIKTLRRAFEYLGTAIKSSMDYDETVNLFQTAFRAIGKKSGEEFEFAFLERAEDFQSSLASKLSVDPNLFMNYQAIFANMASSMGMTSATAYDLSESFTMLGADIASLFNMSFEESMTKLQSALAGQSRAIRSLGVDISNATMAEKALSLGITKNVKDMTQAEKAQLRYIMIMEGLTVAQGDMARTLESPANQLRVLSEQFNQLTRIIGNIFMPIVTKVLPYINALVLGLKKLFSAIASFVGYKQSDFKETPVEIFGSDDAAGEVDDVTGSLKKLKNATLGFDELNIISDSGGSGSGLAGSFDLSDTIAEMNAEYQAMVDKISQDIGNRAEEILASWESAFTKIGTMLTNWSRLFSPAFNAIKSAVEEATPKIKAAFESMGDSVMRLWNNTLSPFLGYFFNEWIPGIVNPVVQTLAPILTQTITALTEVIADVFSKLVDGLNALWNDILHPIMESIKSRVVAVMEAIDKAWAEYGAPILSKAKDLVNGLVETASLLYSNILNPIIKPFLKALQTSWDESISPIVEKIAMFVGKAVDAALDIINRFVLPIVNYLITVLKPTAEAVGNAISIIITAVRETVSKVFGAIIDTLSGLVDFIAGVFTGDWSRAWQGIKDFFEGIWNTIKSIFEGRIRFISAKIEAFQTLFSGIWNSLWKVVGDVFATIWNKIREIFTTVSEWLKKALDSFATAFKRVWNNLWTGVANFFIRIWNKIIGGMESAVNFVINGLNELIEAANKVSSLIGLTFNTIPRISLSRVQEITVQGYAVGGIPDYGELFVAREDGAPEMVGKFGNRTGVANNDQITTGIREAVVSGMLSIADVFKSGSNFDVKVYLDGKQITAAVEKRQRERGATIYPGGVLNGI